MKVGLLIRIKLKLDTYIIAYGEINFRKYKKQNKNLLNFLKQDLVVSVHDVREGKALLNKTQKPKMMV